MDRTITIEITCKHSTWWSVIQAIHEYLDTHGPGMNSDMGLAIEQVSHTIEDATDIRYCATCEKFVLMGEHPDGHLFG